ncbi:amino acid ABC transporter substrate-binding protein [Chromobacterium sp. IIBBL 290-4]|uniref:amino acid ABC transporter substrate-binding protein n=1 Tax=Chromobacterium sp. IIBBL 290-4 TaxID=2953890 RepID=UPI0020B660D9|nr:amino acid ABC transporter substrate-binding protein [Chromobacterium sp. IIBBL 290-4]UTH73163.1 amino acid ABC transporter substrate-binding protein [Chromobacterium sp. IIBBL 290-4]
MNIGKGMAVLVLASLAMLAKAGDLADVRKSGELRIGTEGTYPPFSYHDASGALTGFDVDIARAIAARLGLRAQFVEGRWDGLLAGIDVKRYDVVSTVVVTEARKLKYAFSEPYYATRAVLIVREDNRDIKRFEDLKSRKSANTLTSNYGKLALRYGAEVVPTQGFNESLSLLESGRVDATINDSLAFLDYKKKQPGSKLRVAAAEAEGQPCAIILRKDSPELKAAIDKATIALKTDGTLKRLSQKYFGADITQ